MQNNNNENDDQVDEVASTTDPDISSAFSGAFTRSVASTAAPTNQKVEGPCYAHAAARVLLHAWRHLRPDLELPSLEVLIAVIVAYFRVTYPGSNGFHQSPWKVIEILNGKLIIFNDARKDSTDFFDRFQFRETQNFVDGKNIVVFDKWNSEVRNNEILPIDRTISSSTCSSTAASLLLILLHLWLILLILVYDVSKLHAEDKRE